jgi:hypothetical protein
MTFPQSVRALQKTLQKNRTSHHPKGRSRRRVENCGCTSVRSLQRSHPSSRLAHRHSWELVFLSPSAMKPLLGTCQQTARDLQRSRNSRQRYRRHHRYLRRAGKTVFSPHLRANPLRSLCQTLDLLEPQHHRSHSAAEQRVRISHKTLVAEKVPMRLLLPVHPSLRSLHSRPHRQPCR